MTDINPCRTCQETPEDGYYPGDFAIECPNCLTTVSRHMIDFIEGDTFTDETFETSADLAKEAAIAAWNRINPVMETPSGTQLEEK